MTQNLYIFVRTDIESLNSGKGMAQAAHAANAAVAHANSINFNIEEWENSTDQSFGTTIVLGGSMKEIERFITVNDFECSGVVYDPTYPIKDGDITHLINIATTAYVWGNEITGSIIYREGFNLHP